MSNMEQLVANIKTYEENKPLNDSEMKLIPGIADDMISKKTVPCTGCHYSVFKCLKQPECCIGCKSCEKVCPQTIHISEEHKKFAKKMGRY